MITLRLQVFMFVIWFLLLIIQIGKVANKKTDIRFMLPWLILDLIMIVLTAVPKLISWLSTALGIEVPSNMLFLLGIILLSMIIFSQSNTISQHSTMIRELTQRLAIYEHDSNTTIQNKKDSTTVSE